MPRKHGKKKDKEGKGKEGEIGIVPLSQLYRYASGYL